ncbi:MAG: ROK family protein [Bacilli bacterium]
MSRFIAIDLGGTNLRGAIVDEDLNIHKVFRERSTKYSNDELYKQIKSMVTRLLDSPENDGTIKYIGVSACGFCEDGILKLAPNLYIKDFDIAGRLTKDFPSLTAGVVNDANCSGLIESLKGAAKDCQDSFFITISTGVGTGLIVNRQLVDVPLEMGHIYVTYQNRFYELEQLCSGTGIVLLCNLNGLTVKDAAEFFSLVKTKNPKALDVYEDWLKLLSSVLANSQLSFNPEKIVVSGGLVKSADIFINDLQKVTEAFCAPFPVRPVHLVLAEFDQDTGLMGASGVALSLMSKKR